MVNVKKLSMAIFGAVFSCFALGQKAAYAHAADLGINLPSQPSQLLSSPLVLPKGVYLSLSSPPTNLNDSVFITGDYTNGQFGLIDGFAQPQEGPTPHIHYSESEAFYVLQGNQNLQLGNQTFTAGSGQFVYIPQGTLHTWVNPQPNSDGLRLLVITDPADLIPYLYQLREGPTGFESQGQQGYLNDFVTLGANYQTQVVDSLSFDHFQYSINNNGTSTVTVQRIGSGEGAVSATIVLSDGINKLGKIPVNFAANQMNQSVDVSIPPNLVQGHDTINLTLTKPTGDAIIAPLEAKALLGGDSSQPLSTQELQKLYDFPTLQKMASQLQSFWLGGGTANVVATDKDTNNQYSLFDVSVPGNTKLKPYVDSKKNDGFYLLDGNVSFGLDHQTITLNPGNFIYIPKNQPFAFGNLGTSPARIVVIRHAP